MENLDSFVLQQQFFGSSDARLDVMLKGKNKSVGKDTLQSITMMTEARKLAADFPIKSSAEFVAWNARLSNKAYEEKFVSTGPLAFIALFHVL